MTAEQEAARRSESDIHYHVISSMGGGYMPNTDWLVDSLDDALETIRADISQDEDDELGRRYPAIDFDYEEGYAFVKGYYPEDVSPHDLGWYYEATRHADIDPDHEDCRAILNGEKEAPLV